MRQEDSELKETRYVLDQCQRENQRLLRRLGGWKQRAQRAEEELRSAGRELAPIADNITTFVKDMAVRCGVDPEKLALNCEEEG
jgi:chromosome segregation ATPase